MTTLLHGTDIFKQLCLYIDNLITRLLCEHYQSGGIWLVRHLHKAPPARRIWRHLQQGRARPLAGEVTVCGPGLIIAPPGTQPISDVFGDYTAFV